MLVNLQLRQISFLKFAGQINEFIPVFTVHYISRIFTVLSSIFIGKVVMHPGQSADFSPI
ncbi:hypothetical protein CLW00_106127 [Mongoliibacter ruber]|uniref:Uncharacterized protein n=1 Tax=Mongoliibacter ruber TaxID=1750599 RepID=A0A2T0WLC2_9BACT|nr:hypothetical protein CLW00_106127 [Mongoliibacter ruber]